MKFFLTEEEKHINLSKGKEDWKIIAFNENAQHVKSNQLNVLIKMPQSYFSQMDQGVDRQDLAMYLQKSSVLGMDTEWKGDLVTGSEIEFNVVLILDICHEIPCFEGYELEVAIKYVFQLA